MHPLTDLARPLVIAHRGDRAHVPENTVAAITAAVALGVDAVEFDVRLSADGEVFVLHDPTLERTTDGVGPAEARHMRELRTVDAGYRWTPDGGRTFPFRGRGIRIPTLDEVLDALPAELPVIVELKTEAVASAALAILSRRGVAPRALMGSFRSSALADFAPPFARGATPPQAADALVRLCTARAPAPAYDAICIPPWHGLIPVPVKALARAHRRIGVATHVWTVNDPARAIAYWAAGATGIVTDDPATILEARRTWRARSS
ncbi:MAG: hypothetical protein K2X99_10035 [Gemmatimonadaceae bacterium]|nr:hypothetical protein [Gemmatimonadaceae bacterium]